MQERKLLFYILIVKKKKKKDILLIGYTVGHFLKRYVTLKGTIKISKKH